MDSQSRRSSQILWQTKKHTDVITTLCLLVVVLPVDRCRRPLFIAYKFSRIEHRLAQPSCGLSHVVRVILCQQCRKAFLSSVEVVNDLKSPPYVPAIKVFYKCFALNTAWNISWINFILMFCNIGSRPRFRWRLFAAPHKKLFFILSNFSYRNLIIFRFNYIVPRLIQNWMVNSIK